MAVEDKAFFDWLASEAGGHCHLVFDIGAGRYCAVKPLLFHWTMIIGTIGDQDGFDDRYCYADKTAAVAGLSEWARRSFEGEPIGWHRHPSTGRRRPEGNAAQEYIAW